MNVNVLCLFVFVSNLLRSIYYVALRCICVVGEDCVMMLCERLLKFEPLCW